MQPLRRCLILILSLFLLLEGCTKSAGPSAAIGGGGTPASSPGAPVILKGDSQCQGTLMGSAIAFPDGILIPAVGQTAHPFVKLMFGSDNRYIDPTFASDTPAVVAVTSGGDLSFVAAGTANITATACGTPVTFAITIAGDASTTPSCASQKTRSGGNWNVVEA